MKKMRLTITPNPSYEWDQYAKNVGVTQREVEAFALMASGRSNETIAYMLGIQYQSVKNLLHRLTKKLGAKNGAQMALIAEIIHLVAIEVEEWEK